MPRNNLDGNRWGESQRLTVRLSRRERRALDELAVAWQSDKSEALRRAVRQAAAAVRRQQHEAWLDALPTMTVAQLRAHAARLHVARRSKMTKAELRDALENLRPTALRSPV